MCESNKLDMYDREDERKQCFELIEKRNPFRLFGPRRVGKSTILKMIRKDFNGDVILFNCDIGVNTPYSIIKGLAQACELSREEIDFSDEENWKEIGNEIMEYLNEERSGLVIIIDEFSTALSKMNHENETLRNIFLDWFVKHIKSHKIIFIVAGSISFEKAMDGYSYSRQINDIFFPIKITPFNKLVAEGYILEILKANQIEISEKIAEKLTKHLIKYLGEDGLFPLFIREFTEYCIAHNLEKLCNVDFTSDIQANRVISKFIEIKYTNSLNEIAKCIREGTVPGHYGFIYQYFNAMNDDIKKIIPNYQTQKNTEISNIFHRGIIQKRIGINEVRMMGDDTIEILDSLDKIYIINKDEYYYYFNLKFLYDIWIKLYPSAYYEKIR